MDSDEQWLRTNVQVEALKGLRTCRRHLSEATEDAYELKWAVLAVTASLGAFIAWTYRSVEVLAWDPKALAHFEEWHEGDREGPAPSPMEARIPSFMPLCEKLRGERGWDPDTETWDYLDRLREVRDDFMHFKPKGWSISAAYLRGAISAALDAISYIVTEKPGHFIWYDEALQAEVLAELRDARRLTQGATEE